MGFDTEEQVLAHASALEGMSFRDILNLGISPAGISREYGNNRYKGGLGVLIEERYFGYAANNDREPDLADAGVEIKATCYDLVTKRGAVVESAGERLSLTMIPYDEEMPPDLFASHLWRKCRRILLVWYRRDRSVEPYDQRIDHVILFTPPEGDLRIIERDYALIAGLVRAGRADELSEALTVYLGAATKGRNARDLAEQAFYAPGRWAKRRGYAYKRPYMDYVLHHYVLGEPEPESIVKDPRELERTSLVRHVERLIGEHAGKSDRELCELLGIEYTGNKAQWTTIAYRLLGIQGDRAAEFEKAGIRVRTVRPEPGGTSLKESFPVMNIDFIELADERVWEDSTLFEYLSDLSYLFVVFQKDVSDGTAKTVLKGCMVWKMPTDTLDGPVRECWERAAHAVREGVVLSPSCDAAGKTSYRNNLPGISDNPVAHVRPRAQKAAYRMADGTCIGNVERDAEMLPDGRWMTRQAFWLNSSYILEQISGLLEA